jgi:hypothetical protein
MKAESPVVEEGEEIVNRDASLKKCAEWLSTCLKDGWDKSDLDALEALWWKYHPRPNALATIDIKSEIVRQYESRPSGCREGEVMRLTKLIEQWYAELTFMKAGSVESLVLVGCADELEAELPALEQEKADLRNEMANCRTAANEFADELAKTDQRIAAEVEAALRQAADISDSVLVAKKVRELAIRASHDAILALIQLRRQT